MVTWQHLPWLWHTDTMESVEQWKTNPAAGGESSRAHEGLLVRLLKWKVNSRASVTGRSSNENRPWQMQ